MLVALTKENNMSSYTRGELDEIQAGVYAPDVVTTTFDGTGNHGKIAAKAALTTSLTGTNNDMVFTADANGIAGNSITVEYNITNRAPGHSSAECHTSGNAICVDLKTSAGVAASGVLTSDNTELTDGDTVTIGSIVYRFKDTMAQAYDVKRDGTTADTTLANLVKAINGTGTPGTEYFAGTIAHTSVTASTVAAHATTVTARTIGAAGNLIAKDETSSHLDWDGVGAFLTGGEDLNQVLSLASEVKTAIEANTAAAALVDIANAGGNDGTGVVTVMAATALTGGSDGAVTLFTAEDDGLIAILGDCTVDLTGNTATLEVGLTGNTAALIPQTTATTLDSTERIDRTGVIATSAAPNVIPFFPVRAGDVIKLTVGTATITAGAVEWQMYYRQFDSDAALQGAGNTSLTTIAANTAPPTAISDGLKLVAAAGTREALAASTACKWVSITAKLTNTGVIVVGGTSVVAASGATRRGTPLNAGDSFSFQIDNLNDVNIDATVSGEGVTYTYTV